MNSVTFVGDFLIVDGTAIALKYVESMRFSRDEELTLDKLKDDRNFTIVTSSGKEYTVSVKSQLSDYHRENSNLDIDAYQKSIFDRWRYILTGRP